MPVKLTLNSPDLEAGERIDDRFAGQEGAETPRLEVLGIPDGTVELTVVCHDPDAPMEGGFTHWTHYGLPPQEGLIDASAGRPGPNDDDGVGYIGPFPPAGDGDHRYFFSVYAMETPVAGTPTREEFLNEYRDHVLGSADLVGTYSVE